jgi:hypothetical protein
MTREEAERMCAHLAAEHPDRETHQWRPRDDGNDAWSVVKIALPPGDQGPVEAELRADERPTTPDDPRPSSFRAAPPFGGAGG